MKKIAIVLLNLGGPDKAQSIRPFLRNLFSDKAIIGLPALFRIPLAVLISTLRAPKAKPLYDLMGGYSPLLENTIGQANALTALLNDGSNIEFKVFIAMRYWHPFTKETAKEVESYRPDETILLPLYPHYSITTTGSSLKEWRKHYKDRFEFIESYPVLDGMVKSATKAIIAQYEDLGRPANFRVLFSAHGLPQKIIDAGDPYEIQIRETAQSIHKSLEDAIGKPIDSVVCFQSRVGPLKWLEPTTPSQIEKAAKDKMGVIIYPIAFVSEHIETLVELDVEYKELGHELDLPFFGRAKTCSIDNDFIEGLCHLVKEKIGGARV